MRFELPRYRHFRAVLSAVSLIALLFATAACDSTEVDRSTAAAVVPPPPAPGLDIAEHEFSLGGEHRLGVNLPPVHSWSNTPMYVDMIRQARRFGSPDAPWDEKALLGEDGWPTGDFGIFVMSSQAGLSTVGGTYTLRFRGQARVSVIASPATLGTPRHDPVSNITTIPLRMPPHTDQLALSFTATRGSIKDLRLLRPGYDADKPPLFTREFLDHIAPYKVVRLMDWLRTNHNPVGHWELRATPENTHYASDKGVPWEDLIELARVADKDLWINVPARATDDYVHALARLLRDSLPATTRVYVEYSNEVWNSQFKQSRDNLEAAEREVESNPNSHLNDGIRISKDIWKIRRVAQRGKEISDIFRIEFGDAAMMTRIRPVFAIQIVNTYSTGLALAYMARTFGPPSRYFYAMAGAPYFNMGPVQRSHDLSVDQILGALSDSIAAMPEISRLEQNMAFSRWYQLPLIAYEGGADTFGPGSLAAKKAASLDPRMETLCHRHLDNWYAGGGGLFMWFTAGAGNWNTPYGTWELTTDLAITDTPKIRCLNSVIKADSPLVQSRHAVPGRIDARGYVGSHPPFSKDSLDAVQKLNPGRHLDYLILAPQTGVYQFILHAEAEKSGNRIEVATANGARAGTVELPATDTGSTVASEPLSIPLRKGFNTLRLFMSTRTSDFRLHQLEIR